MKDKLFLTLKVIAFFGVGLIILYLVYQNQQEAYFEECALKGIAESDCSLIDKVIQDFKGAKTWILVVTVVLFMLSNTFRALRWGLLLKPLGYNPRLVNTLGATMIGYLLNLSIPRAGEIAKPASLSKNENIPLDITIGTIVTDRVIDVVCLLIVFGLTVLLAYDRIIDYLDEHIAIMDKFALLINNPILTAAILGIAGLLGYLVLKNRSSLLENKFVNKVFEFAKGIYTGTLSIFKLEKRMLFIFYTIGIWGCYYLMTYLVFFAFAPTEHLTATAGLVVFLFGSLGIVIPSPGGMGSYHFLIGESLGLYGISGIDAFSFANIAFFTIQIFGNIIFGGLAILLLPFFNKKG